MIEQFGIPNPAISCCCLLFNHQCHIKQQHANRGEDTKSDEYAKSNFGNLHGDRAGSVDGGILVSGVQRQPRNQ